MHAFLSEISSKVPLGGNERRRNSDDSEEAMEEASTGLSGNQSGSGSNSSSSSSDEEEGSGANNVGGAQSLTQRIKSDVKNTEINQGLGSAQSSSSNKHFDLSPTSSQEQT